MRRGLREGYKARGPPVFLVLRQRFLGQVVQGPEGKFIEQDGFVSDGARRC